MEDITTKISVMNNSTVTPFSINDILNNKNKCEGIVIENEDGALDMTKNSPKGRNVLFRNIN